MQLYAFFTSATLLAIASISAAQESFYGVSLKGRCVVAGSAFCQSSAQVCPKPFIQSFDNAANDINKIACEGKAQDSVCMEVVACIGDI
ncbi:unnamed protein product [Diplocarpon coronariae]